MDVRIQGTNLELTDDLYALVEAKLADCYRTLGSVDRDPVEVAVELEDTTRRHPHEWEEQRRFRAEANVSVPGRLIRAEGAGDDITQAVVAMKHRLMRELRTWRERTTDARRSGARAAKQQFGAASDSERYADSDDIYEDRYADEIERVEGGTEPDTSAPDEAS